MSNDASSTTSISNNSNISSSAAASSPQRKLSPHTPADAATPRRTSSSSLPDADSGPILIAESSNTSTTSNHSPLSSPVLLNPAADASAVPSLDAAASGTPTAAAAAAPQATRRKASGKTRKGRRRGKKRGVKVKVPPEKRALPLFDVRRRKASASGPGTPLASSPSSATPPLPAGSYQSPRASVLSYTQPVLHHSLPRYLNGAPGLASSFTPSPRAPPRHPRGQQSDPKPSTRARQHARKQRRFSTSASTSSLSRYAAESEWNDAQAGDADLLRAASTSPGRHPVPSSPIFLPGHGPDIHGQRRHSLGRGLVRSGSFSSPYSTSHSLSSSFSMVHSPACDSEAELEALMASMDAPQLARKDGFYDVQTSQRPEVFGLLQSPSPDVLVQQLLYADHDDDDEEEEEVFSDGVVPDPESSEDDFVADDSDELVFELEDADEVNGDTDEGDLVTQIESLVQRDNWADLQEASLDGSAAAPLTPPLCPMEAYERDQS